MKWRILVPLVAILVVLGGISVYLYSQDDDAITAGPAGAVEGQLLIHAVPALAAVADELKLGFEAQNPDATVDIRITPAQGAVLSVAEELGSGVFLGPPPMVDGVRKFDPSMAEGVSLGRNLFVIAVPSGNPGSVEDVSIFDESSGANTAACGPSSAFGNFAELVLEKGEVTPDPAIIGSGCTGSALAQVAAGELEAALVQRATLIDDVDHVDIPDEDNVISLFSMLPLGDDAVTSAFATFVQSEDGQSILTEKGYLP